MSSPPTYGINTGIPAANNNPSQDQPRMQSNFSNLYNYEGIDHILPGQVYNGTHAQLSLTTQQALGRSSPYLPPWNSTTGGNVYLSQFAYPSSNNSNELYFTTGTTNNQIQMTVTDPSLPFSLFGGMSVYQVRSGSQPGLTGGWTFLPGGLALAYGFLQKAIGGSSNGFTILLPTGFTFANTDYVVIITPQKGGSPPTPLKLEVDSITTSQFHVQFDDSPNFVNWIAIGIPA